MGRTIVGMLALIVMAALCIRGRAAPARASESDVIIVLAGGVGSNGVPHETVLRRLRRAAQLYKEQEAATGTGPVVVCNGGGTTHKPKWVDKSGYAIPEAALMGRELISMGVKATDVYAEGYSDDTIGNAFFVRVMHIDVRPEWRRLRVITSAFQMERTKALYDWVFGLAPLPAGKPYYDMAYESVDDNGALPPTALSRRRTREAESLRTFQSGNLVRMQRLAELHEFVNLKHSGYTVDGYLSKKALRSSPLAQSYR